MTVTNNLLVDSNSSINVSDRGYLAGYTLGNTTIGGSTSFAGGSYGGLGGVAGNGAANAVYGDYRDPDNLGSGSGTGDYGSSGGGLVQIMADNAQVDGTILANGGNNSSGGGGGSARVAVLMTVGTLSGAGTIAANGGTGSGTLGGGGGGGRVAIYTWTAMDDITLKPMWTVATQGRKWRNTAPGGAATQNGSVYFACGSRHFTFLNVLPDWHGIEQIAFSTLGVNPNGSNNAQIEISREGVTYFQQGVPVSGIFCMEYGDRRRRRLHFDPDHP